MKYTIGSFEEFHEFCWRYEDRRKQFSYRGLQAIWDYITEWEEATGEEIEFDFIAICCDFTEYENLEEIKKEYSEIETMEDLEERTEVLLFEDHEGIVIRDF